MVLQWYDDGMRTTIDKAGRVVIPKPIREALGLAAGTEVDIQIDGVGIRIDGPEVEEAELVEVDGFLVAPGGEGMTVEDDRRARMRLYGLDENE
jgi:AbrB family looped-hinge helix DNA binding protein